LADVYVLEGRFDQALAEMDKAFSLDPTDWSQLFSRGAILYQKGDLEASRRTFEELEAKGNPGAKIVCNLGFLLLDILQGKFQSSIEYSEKAIALCQTYNQARWEINFRLRLIDLYIYGEKWEEALNHFSQAWKLAVERGNLTKQWLLLVSKGVYFLKSQDVDGAMATASQLKESIESGLNDKAIREYDYLMGLIELENGNSPAAIEHLKKGKNLLPAENDAWDAHSKYSFALGQAYSRTGELEKAQASFEEILTMTSGRLFYPELYVLALYELGRVFQDLGNTGRAMESFERFLEFWKDPDPGLPEVADAKERVAELKERS
jgi:tetratricopeptide (TPR) repeat protein